MTEFLCDHGDTYGCPFCLGEESMTKKEKQEQAEREFIASLPPDRFGVNPPDTRPIVPKGPRKGSKRKMEGG